MIGQNRGAIPIEEYVGNILTEKKMTVACAESCTGGLVTGRLTAVAGSSAYVMGGVVSYTNEVKASVLGVSRKALAEYGAVSDIVAQQMADGIRNLIKTDFGISVTGIAGPGGGSMEKPVGLVYIAVSGPKGVRVVKNNFSGNREEVRESSVKKAVELLTAYVEES